MFFEVSSYEDQAPGPVDSQLTHDNAEHPHDVASPRMLNMFRMLTYLFSILHKRGVFIILSSVVFSIFVLSDSVEGVGNAINTDGRLDAVFCLL